MTANAEVSRMLQSTRWGEQFSPEEIASIAGYMNLRSYANGQAVFEQGDTDPFLAFIVKGKVDIAQEVADSLEKLVVTLGEKTHFGEISFVDNQPRSASAVANGDVVILVLAQEAFRTLLAQQPDLGIKIQQNLLLTICKRLRMTTRELIYRD